MKAQAQTTLATGESYRQMVLRRLWRDRASLVGLAILLALVGSAVLAPVLTPYDPIKQNLDEMLSAPSWKHALGTDRYGRDMLTRIIYGFRPRRRMRGRAGVRPADTHRRGSCGSQRSTRCAALRSRSRVATPFVAPSQPE